MPKNNEPTPGSIIPAEIFRLDPEGARGAQIVGSGLRQMIGDRRRSISQRIELCHVAVRSLVAWGATLKQSLTCNDRRAISLGVRYLAMWQAFGGPTELMAAVVGLGRKVAGDPAAIQKWGRGGTSLDRRITRAARQHAIVVGMFEKELSRRTPAVKPMQQASHQN